MEQNVKSTAVKPYEKIYGSMTRLKAYGAMFMLGASAVMCVVEPIFLGFVAFPLIIAAIAPQGFSELKREFSKEAVFLRDALQSIRRDMRQLFRFGKTVDVEAAAVAAPVEEASALAGKSSRADFGRGVEPQEAAQDVSADNKAQPPANSNAPAKRKNVA